MTENTTPSNGTMKMTTPDVKHTIGLRATMSQDGTPEQQPATSRITNQSSKDIHIEHTLYYQEFVTVIDLTGLPVSLHSPENCLNPITNVDLLGRCVGNLPQNLHTVVKPHYPKNQRLLILKSFHCFPKNCISNNLASAGHLCIIDFLGPTFAAFVNWWEVLCGAFRTFGAYKAIVSVLEAPI